MKKNQGPKLRKTLKNSFQKSIVDFEFLFALRSKKSISFRKAETF